LIRCRHLLIPAKESKIFKRPGAFGSFAYKASLVQKLSKILRTAGVYSASINPRTTLDKETRHAEEAEREKAREGQSPAEEKERIGQEG
jgi:hypothetical protein